MKTAWWRHQLEAFSALLAICAGNSLVFNEFPAKRPVTQSFDVFFDLRLIKRLSEQSWGWWFETLSRPLWRHRNDLSNIVLPMTHRFHHATMVTTHALHHTMMVTLCFYLDSGVFYVDIIALSKNHLPMTGDIYIFSPKYGEFCYCLRDCHVQMNLLVNHVP